MENRNRIGIGGKPVGQQGGGTEEDTARRGIQANRSKMETANRSKMEPANRIGFGGRPVGAVQAAGDAKLQKGARVGFGGKPVGEGVVGRQPKMQTPCNFFQVSSDFRLTR